MILDTPYKSAWEAPLIKRWIWGKLGFVYMDQDADRAEYIRTKLVSIKDIKLNETPTAWGDSYYAFANEEIFIVMDYDYEYVKSLVQKEAK